MDVQKIRYLIALSEHGSFSRAADAVGLTQPAFSRSIQSLEHELDVGLVDRRGRRVQLTPAGQLTVERGRRVLQELSEAHRALARLVRGETGRLRLGAAPLPAARLLTRLIGGMAALRPEMQLTVDVRPAGELVEALRAERIDLLLGDERSVPASEEIVVERVGTWRAALLARAGHPILAGTPTPEHLRQWPIASPRLGAEAASAIGRLVGAGADPARAVSLTLDDPGMLAELARCTDTIVVADPDGIAAGGLVPLDLPPLAELHGTTVLARLAWRTPPAAAAELHRMARKAAARP